jgi:hypothetical protein
MAVDERQVGGAAAGRRYGGLQALALSLFSPAVYRDVALNWRGLGVRYLFLVLAVTWLPAMGALQAAIDDFAANAAPTLLQLLPRIVIKHGDATLDPPEPVVLRDPRNGGVLAVLDTGDGTPPPESQDAVVTLGRTTLVVRRAEDRDVRVVRLADSPFADAVIDRARAETALASVQRWFVVTVAYPVCLAVSWLYRTAEAMVYGLMVAFRMAIALGRPLRPAACIRLAAVALTPVIVLDTLIGILGTPLPFWPIAYFLVTLGYLYLGVSALPRAGGSPPPSDDA